MNRKSFLETNDSTSCTGCGVCAFVCPKGAIAIVEDVFGFEYPKVDNCKCVKCDKCLKFCHMQDMKRTNEAANTCYGAIDNNRDSLRQSASGGVATAISRWYIDNGGLVYGCVANREDVHHNRLADYESLSRAQGSKYVQSDLSRIFEPMSADLNAGFKVLFIGTPCQCAAVKMLFGSFGNLATIDLVCEGVPNRRMYADFLDDLELEREERVLDFRFRDKRGGWSTKNAVVLGENGRALDKQPYSYYYYYYWLFSKALILRDSCYSCPYADKRRVGDVTVGDFWGAESSSMKYGMVELRDGISCVLANTEKGLDLLKSSNLELRDCGFNEISQWNRCLAAPSLCDMNERSRLLRAYSENGASGMKREYRSLFTRKARMSAWITASMPLSIRVALKRIKMLFIRGEH